MAHTVDSELAVAKRPLLNDIMLCGRSENLCLEPREFSRVTLSTLMSQ